MQFIVSLLVLAAAIFMVNGLCNTCSLPTGIACVGDSSFQVCSDSLPTGPIINCPTGTLCSPNGPICDTASGTVSSSCARCNTCNAANVFACTSYNTFTLCTGGGITPGAPSYPCAAGLVCNVDAPNICVNTTETGIGGTCPLPVTTQAPPTQAPTSSSSTSPPTTPNPATNPQAFCQQMQVTGLYEVPSDTTCRQYVSCVVRNGMWQGTLYTCAKKYYFNQSTETCTKTKPTRCP